MYAFLGLQPFVHDFEKVEFDADEFDRKLGGPGLHRVRRAVRPNERATLLPPDLFARLQGDSFWLHPALNTRGVQVV